MSAVIDMPFSFDDLEKPFEVIALLDNREELIQQFKPEVVKYIVKEPFFHGRARIEYERMFNELIASLIKREIIKHHSSWSPEDILLLTDIEFLKLITNDFYFTKSNYTKEGV